MFFEYGTPERATQSPQEESQEWGKRLEEYLAWYCERLDASVDRRIVGTLKATVVGLLQTRSELTLTELGSTILGPEHAEAGTQRLKRAIGHEGWHASWIEEMLWEQADQFCQQAHKQGEVPLCIWDSSVLEKPESEKLEGLGRVRSSRVKRLARTRKGVFNRPSGVEVECAWLRVGKPDPGGQKWGAPGRYDVLVEPREAGAARTTMTIAG